MRHFVGGGGVLGDEVFAVLLAPEVKREVETLGVTAQRAAQTFLSWTHLFTGVLTGRRQGERFIFYAFEYHWKKNAKFSARLPFSFPKNITHWKRGGSELPLFPVQLQSCLCFCWLINECSATTTNVLLGDYYIDYFFNQTNNREVDIYLHNKSVNHLTPNVYCTSSHKWCLQK